MTAEKLFSTEIFQLRLLKRDVLTISLNILCLHGILQQQNIRRKYSTCFGSHQSQTMLIFNQLRSFV